VSDEQRLVFGVVTPVQADQVAGVGFGPQLLPLARLVVLHHGARRRQNVLGRAVILLQADRFSVGIVVLEIQDILDIGAAPAINRLVFIADYADIAMLFRQQ